MKKRFIVILVILIIVTVLIFTYIKNKKDISEEQYKYNITQIEEIKNNIGITGNSNLYEISKDYNGEDIISIKADLQYKVALAGAVIHNVPELSKIDEQISNVPQDTGIWIEEQSRERFLEIVNDVSEGKYNINQNGYLEINNKNKDEYAKKINKLINGKKKIRIALTSSYYIIDNVTGEIGEFPYEEVDPYQIYEYIELKDELLILITENTRGYFTNQDILNEILQVMYN